MSFVDPYVLSLWMKLTVFYIGDSAIHPSGLLMLLWEIFAPLLVETPMIAMTATATKGMMAQIEKSIGMFNPAYVVESPNRLNIRFSVCHVKEASSSAFSWLLDELKAKKDACEKVIIFCRRIDDCAMLYQSFAIALGADSYLPSDDCCLQNVLFGMFHAKIADADKEVLLESFSKSDGKCRVIISTIAFGMGVNISNVRCVVHFGPSSNIDNYVQESGQAGRDNKPSHAVIYLYPGALRGNVSKDMKKYCWNESRTCRRQLLFRSYLGTLATTTILHDCCDICMSRCMCGECIAAQPKCISGASSSISTIGRATVDECGRQWTSLHAKVLRSSLQDLRSSEMHDKDTIPLQPELVTGISDKLIDSIVHYATHISTVDDLHDMCSVWGNESDILELIGRVKALDLCKQ